MKKSFFLLSLCMGVMGFLFTGTGQAAGQAANLKIGLIDTQKIIQQSKAAKKAREAFTKDVEAKRNLFQEKQNEVRTLAEELQKGGQGMTPEVRKEKSDNLEREDKELRRLKTDLEDELKKKDMELTSKLLKEINDIVQDYRKKENYTLILERKSVVAADDAIDITDKIIRLYDTLK